MYYSLRKGPKTNSIEMELKPQLHVLAKITSILITFRVIDLKTYVLRRNFLKFKLQKGEFSGE